MSQECVIKFVCPAPLSPHLGLKGKEEACVRKPLEWLASLVAAEALADDKQALGFF